MLICDCKLNIFVSKVGGFRSRGGKTEKTFQKNFKNKNPQKFFPFDPKLSFLYLLLLLLLIIIKINTKNKHYHRFIPKP